MTEKTKQYRVGLKYDISDNYPKELRDIITKNTNHPNYLSVNSEYQDQWFKDRINDDTNVFKTRHGAEHFHAQLLEWIDQKIETVDDAKYNLEKGKLRVRDDKYLTYLFSFTVDSEDEVKSLIDKSEEYLYDLKRNDPFIIEEREVITTYSDWEQA